MKNGGVDFPVGRGIFFVCGWELFMAMELGLVTGVKYIAVFQPAVINDFSDYVLHFYDQKKNAKTPADREFAKLMLNSCYGKFALNPREFVDVIVTEYGREVPWRAKPIFQDKILINQVREKCNKLPNKIVTIKGEKYCLNDDLKLCAIDYYQHSFDDYQRGLTFWQLQSETDEGKMRFYNVATAASITSKVRAFLMRSLSHVKTPLYCDTDSIICANGDALIKSDDLGDWKSEMKVDALWLGGKKLYVAHCAEDKGYIDPPEKYFIKVTVGNWSRYYETRKDYKASWKMASKGVRLSVPDLIAVCEGEERTHTFEAPNYSVFSESKFITRTIRRDDKRNKKGTSSPNMIKE
jgi:hypothetical protein